MNKKSTNWIQDMSDAQRKKQGITTVTPNDSSTIHPHQDKLKQLRKVLEDFQHGKGKNLPLDSMQGRMFEADLYKVEELMEKGTNQILEDKNKFLGAPDFLTKEEMLEMNMLYRLYKVTNGEVPYAEQIERAKKMVNDQ